jgi:hypothetical protein
MKVHRIYNSNSNSNNSNNINKDVFYNYIDATLMTESQTKRAFKAMKEFHVITP